MQTKFKKIFVLGVIAECFCIILLLFYIGTIVRKTKMGFQTNITPLHRKSLQFPIDTPLLYYYELIPNTVKEDDFSYMGLPGVARHTINADGLNERNSYTVEKPKSTFRIVTLGDSFAEGAFVDTEDNYSEVLEDMLNSLLFCKEYQDFEVINLGVAGYDMQYNLERLKRKGIKYSPDLFILWTDENDYISHNEKYYSLAKSWDPVKEAPDRVALYQSEGDFAPEANAVWYKFNTLYSRTTIIAEELTYLRDLIQLTQGNLLIFSLHNTPKDLQQLIQLIVRQYQNSYYFPDISDTYDAFPDNHPSVEGHKQFAQFLYQKLKRFYFTDCVSY